VTQATGVLGALVDGLRGPVLAVLAHTLLAPLTLGPAVAAAWAVTRDIGFSLLTCCLLYAVVRAPLDHAAGLPGTPPWASLPRLGLAALGCASSLALVRGLLALDAALTRAIASALPEGGGLLRPLTAGLALSALPALLDVGADAVALLLLLGLAALACFYVVRAAEVVLLTLALPVAAALWVVPAAQGVWRAVLGELVVAVFVQPLQALVLLAFAAGLTPAPGQPEAWLWGLGVLWLLFRVRRLLADVVGAAASWHGLPALGRLAPRLGPRAWLSARLAREGPPTAP
jgi:hypothetical protein